ncbi:MAG: N-formylglutamate amidohydrolase [Desulfarculus sp.]|nr:N-formylglutamate amidohydrolase [Desulfarculus sp.]
MTLPLVISLPHCASVLPPEIAPTLALDPLRCLVEADLGTAEVFAGLPVLACLKAQWSRLAVDLNRDAHDRGPQGVIALVSFGGRPVFLPGQEPSPQEVERRLAAYYHPYHQGLAQALTTPGLKAFLDCHAMDPVGPPQAPDAGRARAQVVLGNRGGDTCSMEMLERLGGELVARGFEVAYNTPYSGGFITRHHGPGLKARGIMAAQVELNKALYLDLQRQELIAGRLEDVRRRVEAALRSFAAGL